MKKWPSSLGNEGVRACWCHLLPEVAIKEIVADIPPP